MRIQGALKKKTLSRPKTSVAKKADPFLQVVRTIDRAIADTKGKDVSILDVRGKAGFADYLIIATGMSKRQVSAVAGRIEEAVFQKHRLRPLSTEGQENATWVLMDYGDIVCHVFLDEVRSFYRLEDLWHNAKHVKFREKAS